MTWLCKIGIHRWKPVKVFGSYIATHWTGYECFCCRERQIKRNHGWPATPETTQAAYDWLNGKSEAKATVLELVKK